jgi:hypothetical protein
MVARKLGLRVFLPKKLVVQPILTTKHLTNTIGTLINKLMKPKKGSNH